MTHATGPATLIGNPEDDDPVFNAIIDAETWSVEVVKTTRTLNHGVGEKVQVLRNRFLTDGHEQITYSLNLVNAAIVGWADLDAGQFLDVADAIRRAVHADRDNPPQSTG